MKQSRQQRERELQQDHTSAMEKLREQAAAAAADADAANAALQLKMVALQQHGITQDIACEAFKQQCAAKDVQVAALQGNIEAKTREVARLCGELEASQQLSASRAGEVDGLQSKLQTLTSKLAVSSQNRETEVKQLAGKEHELVSLQRRFNEQREEVVRQQARCEAAEHLSKPEAAEPVDIQTTLQQPRQSVFVLFTQ